MGFALARVKVPLLGRGTECLYGIPIQLGVWLCVFARVLRREMNLPLRCVDKGAERAGRIIESFGILSQRYGGIKWQVGINYILQAMEKFLVQGAPVIKSHNNPEEQ